MKLLNQKQKKQRSSADKTLNKKRYKKFAILAVVILAVAILAVVLRSFTGRRLRTESQYTYATVEKRDITQMLTGSGTLQPADSYNVYTLVSGNIESASFEEGDIVRKGQTLYIVDNTDASSSVEQARNNLDQAQAGYNNARAQLDDLNLKAGGTGTIIELDVETGDIITAGQKIAVIRDADTVKVTVLFQKAAVLSFYIGESATVTADGSFDSYTGTVTSVGAGDIVRDGYSVAREVTVELSNPGAIAPGQTPYVAIGGFTGLEKGTVSYKYEGTVTAAASGTVSKVAVTTGGLVSKNQLIAVISSDSVNSQVESAHTTLENAKLSLDNQNDKLTDYTITSPINGTIVDKYYKEGEKTENGKTLCVIYDLSSLTLTLNVDELDINKISVGQTAIITADAVEGKTYGGKITRVGLNGTTVNGVTTYPVSIKIDKTDGLRPAMNVDVSITLKESRNVLSIPADAIGHDKKVLVKTADGSTGEGAPTGFKYLQAVTGATDSNYVEIVSGLSEGDTVAYILDTASTSTMFGRNPFGGPGGNQNPGGNANMGVNAGGGQNIGGGSSEGGAQ